MAKFLYWLTEQALLAKIILIEEIPLCLKYHHHHRHHRLFIPGRALVSSWGFVTIFFYGVRLLASRPTPAWRARVSLFVWVITLDLSGMGGPTSSIRYYQHSSRDHMTTQPPPPPQSRDTFGEGGWGVEVYNDIIYWCVRMSTFIILFYHWTYFSPLHSRQTGPGVLSTPPPM